MKYFQQGDVVLKPINKIPAQAKRKAGPVVQYGEHTGHSHKFETGFSFTFNNDESNVPQALFNFYEKDGITYIELLKDTPLVHEEHKTINVPEGLYEVHIVREYDHFAEEARQVLD